MEKITIKTYEGEETELWEYFRDSKVIEILKNVKCPDDIYGHAYDICPESFNIHRVLSHISPEKGRWLRNYIMSGVLYLTPLQEDCSEHINKEEAKNLFKKSRDDLWERDFSYGRYTPNKQQVTAYVTPINHDCEVVGETIVFTFSWEEVLEMI